MTSPTPPNALAALLRHAETLARAAVWCAGALRIANVLLISFDVLARKFLGFTTGGADELSSYAFAVSTSWSLAFATLQRANVRVDVLYQYFPVRLAAIFDWVSLVALGVGATAGSELQPITSHAPAHPIPVTRFIVFIVFIVSPSPASP